METYHLTKNAIAFENSLGNPEHILAFFAHKKCAHINTKNINKSQSFRPETVTAQYEAKIKVLYKSMCSIKIQPHFGLEKFSRPF